MTNHPNRAKLTPDQAGLFTPSFIEYWLLVNAALEAEGVPSAFWGDVHNCFDAWSPRATPTEAAHHIMLLRGEA
jgi:hypothetical protein